jgi:hypothetical protein
LNSHLWISALGADRFALMVHPRVGPPANHKVMRDKRKNAKLC